MGEKQSSEWSLKTKGFKEAQDKIQKISNSVKEVNIKFENLKGKTHDVVKEFREFENKGTNLADKLEKASVKVDRLGTKFKNLGESMSVISDPAEKIVKYGLNASKDLEKSINRAATITDKAILPVERLKKSVRSISDSTGVSQKDVADSVYASLVSGIPTEKVLDFVKSGINLTKIGFTDMDRVIESTISVLDAYGNEVYSINDIHDIFIQAQSKGRVSIDELGKHIGLIVPTAASLGIGLEELAVSYSILGENEQTVNSATENLNQLLEEISKNGGKVDKVLRGKTGKSFKMLVSEGKNLGEVLELIDKGLEVNGQSFEDVFGDGAKNAAETIKDMGASEFNSKLDSMRETPDREKQNEKISKLDESINRLKNSSMDMVDTFGPAAEKLAENLDFLNDKFNGLDDSTKDAFFRILGITALVAPVLIATGSIIKGLSPLLSILGKIVSLSSKVAGFVGSKTFLAIKAIGGGSLLAGLSTGTIAAGTGLAIYGGYKNVQDLKEIQKELGREFTSKERLIISFSKPNEDIRTLIQNNIDYENKIKNGELNPDGSYKQEKDYGLDGISRPQFNGSHRIGLTSVPFDGYIGQLHKDEMVLPKTTADAYRNQGGTINSVPNNFIPNTNIYVTVEGNATEDTANIVASKVEAVVQSMFRKIAIKGVV